MKTIAALSISALAASAAAQPLRPVDLGTLGGQSYVFEIASSGLVAGYSAIDPRHNNFHAFLSDLGSTVDAGVLPGSTNAAAFAFDGQDAVGMSYSFQDLTIRALRWHAGVLSDLGPFAARGANNAGVIVGFTRVEAGGLELEHACRWQAGQLADLGTLGGSFSWAYDVNDAGWIVGSSFLADDMTNHACLWIAGAPHDLGTLGGRNSQARSINNARQAVGSSDTPAGPRACLFTLDAAGNVVSRTNLGAINGWSHAYAINSAGAVVGASASKAVLWRNGAPVDLNTLIPPAMGWRLEVASAIDDSDRIAGWGYLNGRPAAFLLVCAADFNADGFVDFFDLDSFIEAFESGDPRSDFNLDGFTDFFDFDAFVAAFEAGC